MAAWRSEKHGMAARMAAAASYHDNGGAAKIKMKHRRNGWLRSSIVTK